MTKHNPTSNKRYALCIGIGEYTDPTMLGNDFLRYPIDDARAIDEALSQPAIGGFNEVKVLTTPTETTRAAIEDALAHFFQKPGLSASDLLFVFISAHGLLDANGDYVLLASDARKLLAESGESASNETTFDLRTIINIYDWVKYFNIKPLPNVVLVFDTCHSGGATIAFDVAKFESKANVAIIAAALDEKTTKETTKLGHGVLTKSLLKAFEKLKPTRQDGWLTVDELKMYVVDAVPALANDPNALVKTSIRSVANVPLVQNPAYSLASLQFCNQVKEVLSSSLISRRINEELEPEEDTPPNYFTFEKSEDGRRIDIGVITYYNEVVPLTEEQVRVIGEWAASKINDGELDRIWLLTARNLSKLISRTFEKIVGPRSLSLVRTLSELEEDSNPFKDEYLESLWNNFALPQHGEPALKDVYVDILAEERIYDSEKARNLNLGGRVSRIDEELRGYSTTQPFKLENVVQDWLDNRPDEQGLIIVADYGTGKTTFCDYFGAKLAKRRLDTPIHERKQHRIPLVLPLREFADTSKTKLKSHIATFYQNASYYKIRSFDVHSLDRLAKQGQILYMLDGFDEMATRADANKVQTNFNLFRTLIEEAPANKFIITTRPEYFSSLSRRLELMKNYRVIYLRLFKQGQVLDYLDRKTGNKGKAAYERIKSIYDLTDLVQRPVLLKMIVETLPHFEKGQIITRPDLYKQYLMDEDNRQRMVKDRTDMRITPEHRLKIAQHLAWFLYERFNENGFLSNDDIQAVCSEDDLFGTLNRQEREEELNEIRTCTYLVEWARGYRFSHKSFWEYLLAAYLYEQIEAGDNSGLSLHVLNLNIIEFLAEMRPKIANMKKWLLESHPGIDEIECSNLHLNCSELLLAVRLMSLRQQTRLSSSASVSSYLDPGYITNAEYMVFIHRYMQVLQDEFEQTFYQPDSWQHLRYNPSEAKVFEPVCGLTITDANKFLQFLNGRYPRSNYYFRLPYQNEVDDNQTPNNIGYWIQVRDRNYELAGLTELTKNAFGESLQEFLMQIYEKQPISIPQVFTNLHILASTLDYAVEYVINAEIEQELQLVLTYAFGLDLSFVYLIELATDRSRIFDIFLRDFEDGLKKALKLQPAQNLAAELLLNPQELKKQKLTPGNRRALILLEDIVKIGAIDDWREARKIAYRYNRRFAEFIYYSYTELEHSLATNREYNQEKELWRNMYWWTYIAEARFNNELPSFEGLRLVCEYKENNSENEIPFSLGIE
jgi:hypothetical protein